VQMNIADKRAFYGQIARVLGPRGRLLFHDVFQGPGGALHYPVPWAEDASISRPYQDLECIMPHDQSPSVGGVYAKLRGSHPAGWEFTGDDGVN